MEAAIRSHQVGTGQQSAQQPQSDLSGVRGTTAGPPQHNTHSMSQYSQPRNNASGGINEVHRSSATSSAYQIPHTIPHSYVNVDQRNRVRAATNTFSGAPATPNKTNYNWQPNAPFEYAARTTLHQPTMGTVPTNFVNASFASHGGFPPRVTIPQQPPSQPPQVPHSQSQNVPNAIRQLVSDCIPGSIRDNPAAHLQASQPQQRPQQPPPPELQQHQQILPPQQQGLSSKPVRKKIRLSDLPYELHTNSLHHPAAAPSSMPVRLHHASYDKAGPPLQSSNSPVVVHVASTPRTHQNPVVGATAEIQYQPQKPPVQQPQQAQPQPSQQQQSTHQIPATAAPQTTVPPSQQSSQSQVQQQQPQQQVQPPPSNTNTKVLSMLKIDTCDPPSNTNNSNSSNSSSNTNSNNNNNNNNNNSNNNNTNNNSSSVSGNSNVGYHPKTEAISPAGSPKLSKDDLLHQISSVDMSMVSLVERKRILKEKERTLIEQKDNGIEDVPEQPTPHRTLAQQIYAENKKKATDSHAILNAFNFKGQTFELPLYNQPSDADVCRKIHEQYLTFRSSLLLHLRKIKSERAQRNQELSDQYSKLSAEWQKRIEKRKNREHKNRELFEKVFVELRKQREDKERFNRVGSRVKSEADFEVIVDGLQEQAQEDKKMRSYAVIPPIMFDSRQRRLVFQNENGSKVDMEAELSAYKTVNLWTSGEKEIFRDKYVQQAKNFGFIASHLERKNPQDCVRYYYLSKKDVKYKQLLRKSSKRTRSSKNLPKMNESQSLLDLMTTGVTTRLQRKSRNTSRSSNATSATASAADSQTSNSTSTRSSSSAPLPTITVTVNNSSTQSQENNAIKEEIDPLCIKSMSESASPSPASNSNNSNSNSATRRGSSNGSNSNQNADSSSIASTSTASTTTTTATSTVSSFHPDTKIKTDPNGDVVMKTESDSSNWSTYPPNGLKHEVIKTEDIKTEGKTTVEDVVKKDETSVKEEKKIDIKKEPNDDKENEEGKGKNTIPMEVDEDNWSSCEPSAKKLKIEENATNDLDKALYPCFVCKHENCSRTRPLEKAKAKQYGLTEENIPAAARVCSNCQTKAVKSRFPITTCPLPNCPNPKDRVTRLRNLPARLTELPPEERDPIIKELQIPPKVTKCCSVCLTRIKRKMGTHLLGTNSLTDDEIQQFRKQLQDIGPKWNQLAEQLNKSATVLRTFYFHYKKKYGFDQAVNEYYKLHVNEDRRAITDGDESDVSVTSSDDNASEHAKNEFNTIENEKVDGSIGSSNNPIVKTESQIPSATPSSNPIMPLVTSKENIIKNESLQQQQTQQPQIPTTLPQPQQIIDDRLPPPLGQPPPLLSSQQIQNLSTMPRAPDHPMIHIMRTKKHSEEYDSSATETADEENESSPANRQSPKTSSVFAGKSLNPTTTISMVPSAQQNGPSNVRDVMNNVIERSLKSSSVPQIKPNPPSNLVDTSPDVSYVASYRQDPKTCTIPSRRTNADSHQALATLSIVNSHGPQLPGSQNPQIITGHQLNISSIAATITPVPPPPQANQPPRLSGQPHMNSVQDKDMKYGRQIPPPISQPEPEPQTLDLSIKKPQQQQQQPPERNFPAFQAKAPPPPTGGSIYRGDPTANIPNQSYLAFHPEMNRPSKSPSTYITPSLSPNQPRVMNLAPHPAMQQPPQLIGNKSKVTQKLSPKVHHHQVQQQQQQGGQQVQQLNGPKGSITHGTPLNDRGQPILLQSSPQGARYDMLRQTPPQAVDNKFGSITAGTPIHLSDKRVHDYMKGNNRHSPATNQPQNVSSQPTMPSYRQPGEMSSTRDLVFSDYLISQQMQGHNQQPRGAPNLPNTINIISGPGRPEKESPSPRSLAHSSSPASIYYADKERERAGSGQTRTEYLSRSSPADHHNSTPSPHRTPPPQRQGVIIQRHNTGSKPPSPAPSRITQGHFAHHYSQGHDALSSLVDVAVAQQPLSVPNDNARRHMPPITSESQSMPRERYPYLTPSDVVAIQQQNQIEMMRRQHELERKEREMIQERERDRERDEREAQRRLDADLAQRNFERDRMEHGLRIPYQSRLGYDRSPDESVISAQRLINAIITENITRPNDARDRYSLNPMSRLQQAENNGNSHSPNIINVDVDSSSDLSRHQSSISNLPSKNLKLNDITDAIIAKDPSFGSHHQQPGAAAYHLSSPHFVRTGFSNANTISSKTPPTQSMAQLPSSIPQPMGQGQIIATDQWKMNRRLQQQQQQKEEMAKSANSQGRSTTPDDRHVIRMAQTPSPRTKMAYEPVSPPETSTHYHMQPKITIRSYDQQNVQINAPDNAGGDANKLLNMLNSRIAEAMRNDDKYSNDHHGNADARKDRRDSDVMKQYDRPRSGNSIPGNGIDSGEKSPAGKRESPQVYISRPSSQPSNQPFQPAMFMYPFSALTIPQAAGGANPIISPKAASELIDANRQQSAPQTQHLESRQVLSEQYDALSDED